MTIEQLEKKVQQSMNLSWIAMVLSLIALLVFFVNGGNSNSVATGPEAFYLAQAKENGVRKSTFEKCMESPEVLARVKSETREANNIGGQGTPFNVITFADGTVIAVPGAYPYEAFADIISRGTQGLLTEEEKATTTFTLADFNQFNPEVDFYKGSSDAAVTIYEWSDFECPYCASVHTTLSKIVEDFPNVRWVYRQLPLGFHPQAENAAKASICIGQHAGNEGFWNFADAVFADQKALK